MLFRRMETNYKNNPPKGQKFVFPTNQDLANNLVMMEFHSELCGSVPLNTGFPPVGGSWKFFWDFWAVQKPFGGQEGLENDPEP